MAAVQPSVFELPLGSDPALSAAAAADLVRPLWRAAFGPKALGGGSHLLRTSVGLRRITRFQDLLFEVTGSRVPIGVLLQLGTAEAVAAALASGVWPKVSTQMLMRQGPRTGGSMYIVAAASGLILELCDLATAIDFPGDVWGVQSPGIDGECVPLTSIEAIARHHVATLCERGVEGGITLVGYSFSGIVVLEMAKLLRAAGYRVELVALLDSNIFQRYWPRGAWLRFALGKVGRRLRELRGMPLAAAWRHLAAQVRALRRMQVRRRSEGVPGALPDASAVTGLNSEPAIQQSMYYVSGLPDNVQKVRDAHIIAFESYEPKRIDWPVVLFKSALGDPHACDPEPVWRRLAPELEVVIVPGSHTTMVRKPHVVQLAREVMAALERSREPSNPER